MPPAFRPQGALLDHFSPKAMQASKELHKEAENGALVQGFHRYTENAIARFCVNALRGRKG